MTTSKSRFWMRGSVAALAACAIVASPLTGTPASAAIVEAPITYSASDAALNLTPIGTYETGVFDKSAAEIVQVHEDRIFAVNAQEAP